MTEHTVGIQPSVLKWAREKAGYSLNQVSHAMGKDPSLIKAWEAGTDTPTYVQLEKLAYQLYKRPIAIFFFPEPPSEPDLKKSFRTLPDSELEAWSADTRYALRQALATQIALLELNDGVNRSRKQIFREIKLGSNSNVVRVVDLVREYLGVSLEKQIEWHSDDEALKSWREQIEEAGIFVFKRSFKQKSISGFCLAHEEFPLIYLNNSQPKTRQIFTLFHELAHILFHINGVTKQDDEYIGFLPDKEKRIEQLCNRFASEFLVPASDLEERLRSIKGVDEGTVSVLANRYKVSREMILRKLLDRGVIKKEYYKAKAAQWTQQYLDSRSQSQGGDYYATQATYLGKKYLSLVLGKYYQGRLTIEQVADYLGVKSKSVAGLEEVYINTAVPA